jgi:peptide chain release factor 1
VARKGPSRVAMLPLAKLDDLAARHSELEERLCQPDVVNDTKRYMALMKERADLTGIVEEYARFRDVEKRLEEDREALNDPELRELVQAEIPELEAELGAI